MPVRASASDSALAVDAGARRQDGSPATLDTVVGGTAVSVRGLFLTVARGGRGSSVRLHQVTGVDSIARVYLVDARAAATGYYVLLYLTGSSRTRAQLPGDQGCAPEAGLAWVAFDSALRQRKTQGAVTASCRDIIRQIEPEELRPPRIVRGIASVTYDEMPGALRHAVSYSARHPERGLHDVGAR